MTTCNAHQLDFPFHNVWSVSDRQKDWLTCSAISPSGMWLMSGSQDGTIAFVDYKAGVFIGILDFESNFYPTAAIWRSDTTLIFGCSNGVVYHLDFEHKSRRPVGAHAIVKSLESPVRAIAFDTFCDMLSVACDGEVWIYVQTNRTGADSWDCVDHILAPCAGPPALVTALGFFGTNLSRRHLFIGHAVAGWTISFAPQSFHRVPLTDDGNVCNIGSATIPPSKQFIVIATLDNAFVTYSLGEGGPIVNTQFRVDSKEANYHPVLLTVSISNDLVAKGTGVSKVEVLDLRTRLITSLHHAPYQIICTLDVCAGKVVVGSSTLTKKNSSSSLRCYTISAVAEPRDWRRTEELQGPTFEITLNDILPFAERVVPYDPLGIFGVGHMVWFKIRQKQSIVFLLVGLVVLLLALAMDPPSRISSVSAQDVQVLRTPSLRSAIPSRKPTLSALIRWCAGYLSNEVSEWVIWLTRFIVWALRLAGYGGLTVIKNLFFAFTSFTCVVFLVPRLLKVALGEVPDILANFICDILRIYGFDDVCPE